MPDISGTEVGKFRDLFVLQKQRATFQGPSGAKPISYDVIATDVWGSLEGADGNEPAQAGTQTAYTPYKITTRYDPAIDPTCRFVLNDEGKTRYFNVISTYSPQDARWKSVSRCRENTSVNG